MIIGSVEGCWESLERWLKMENLFYLEISTPQERHTELTAELFFELRKNFADIRPYLKKEDKGLCYEKDAFNAEKPILIDANAVKDALLLNECSTVVPDILLFDKNRKMLSEDTLKVAGYPDLVIEVWSKWNDKKERLAKRYIYSTGKNTEHWYLTQNSNKIECWFEDVQLPNKSLKKILTTQGG